MREGSRLGQRERLRLLQHPQSFGQLCRGFGASPPRLKGQAFPHPPHSVTQRDYVTNPKPHSPKRQKQD